MNDTEPHKPPDEITLQCASVQRRSSYRLTPAWLGLIGIVICIVNFIVLSLPFWEPKSDTWMGIFLGFLVAEGVVTVSVIAWAISDARRQRDAKLLARPLTAAAVTLFICGAMLLPTYFSMQREIAACQAAFKARMTATAPASQSVQP